MSAQTKKVSIPAKRRTVDDWVEGARSKTKGGAGKLKRLTLDLPEAVHKAIKRRAVDEGTTMVELLRTLLEKHFGTKK
jgi:predicted DNA binding CopG/RHH family protein